jgi:hypothetical protein
MPCSKRYHRVRSRVRGPEEEEAAAAEAAEAEEGEAAVEAVAVEPTLRTAAARRSTHAP